MYQQTGFLANKWHHEEKYKKIKIVNNFIYLINQVLKLEHRNGSCLAHVYKKSSNTFGMVKHFLSSSQGLPMPHAQTIFNAAIFIHQLFFLCYLSLDRYVTSRVFRSHIWLCIGEICFDKLWWVRNRGVQQALTQIFLVFSSHGTYLALQLLVVWVQKGGEGN